MVLGNIDTKLRSTMAQQQPFRFLDLPPEIRTKIYYLLTISPTRYTSFCISPDWPSCLSSFPTFPYSLLLTCTQIYHEARSAYFIGNTFSICVRRRNTDWDYFLSPYFQDNRRQIRSLRILIQRWGTKDFFTKKLIPVIEDCILNGKLRVLEVLVKDRYLKKIEDLWTGEGGIEGDENENRRALKRLCEDPYLESLSVRACPVDVFWNDLDSMEAENFLDVTRSMMNNNR